MNRYDIRKVLETFMARGLIDIKSIEGEDALRITFMDKPQLQLQTSEPEFKGCIQFECQRGFTFWVSPQDIAEYQRAYPGLDVNAELKKTGLWLNANHRNLKTKAGMPRFILAWLGRAQDRGGSPAVITGRPARKDDPQAHMSVDTSHEAWLRQMREFTGDPNWEPPRVASR